jgi:hypothetical protein
MSKGIKLKRRREGECKNHQDGEARGVVGVRRTAAHHLGRHCQGWGSIVGRSIVARGKGNRPQQSRTKSKYAALKNRTGWPCVCSVPREGILQSQSPGAHNGGYQLSSTESMSFLWVGRSCWRRASKISIKVIFELVDVRQDDPSLLLKRRNERCPRQVACLKQNCKFVSSVPSFLDVICPD